MNAEHDFGASIVVSDTQGLGVPSATGRAIPRARADGATIGDSYTSERYPVIVGTVKAATTEAALTARDMIAAAASTDPVALTVTRGASVRSCMVKRSGEMGETWTSDTSFDFDLLMVAPDPRFTAAALTGSTGLPSSTGGLTVPFTVPFAIESTVSSGQVTLTNAGNAAGRVVLRITGGSGGLTAPVVTHVSSGRSLVFASSLTIDEGVYVDVDMDAHTVLEQGIAARNGWVVSRQWSQFQPGGNLWAFSAASGEGTMHVTAYPSWV